ncbi:MAG: signal peptidase II [Ruminiclostridium sp.]|nr:signal peptidase II [Ruminiclostridium sp.]
MKNKTSVSKILFVVIALVLAAIDQLTKYLVVAYLKPVGSVPLIQIGETHWLDLTYCENTGMSFSLLEGQRVILIAIPVLLIAAVTWIVFSRKLGSERTDMMIALAALAGGGLGNLIDRVFQGYVVDFIDVRIINFAIFNFADICAVCGGIYFGIMIAVDEIREDRAKKAAKENGNAVKAGDPEDKVSGDEEH